MLKYSYNYLVVEDDEQVCLNLERRMHNYSGWNCLELTQEFERAREIILHQRPHLLFLDYAIKGGNSFALLDELMNLENYHPYIIFFTGYLTEKQEIAEGITNKYKVNKYLNKPIHEKLTEYLDDYISEAEVWISQYFYQDFWIETVEKKKTAIRPDTIVCISQSRANPRNKIIRTSCENEYEIRANWAYCEEIVNQYGLDYFFANSRDYLVVKTYITHIQKPNIWLMSKLRIPVSKDNWHHLREA